MNRWYPNNILALTLDDTLRAIQEPSSGSVTTERLEMLFYGMDKKLLKIAEFGVWQGGTSAQYAKFLANAGELHLFDFDDNANLVQATLSGAGFKNVKAWGCSYKHLDSYNWSLRRIMEAQRDLRFDYVYLDGAHTWAIDALTFFLCDMMLNVGGYIEFDDYEWRLRGSSLDPAKVPVIAEQYTDEQVDDYQVAAIVNLLVRRKSNYREIVKNRVFQKMAP